jgi:hypothetical protein
MTTTALEPEAAGSRMTNARGPGWIRTYSGSWFEPLNPDPAAIDIRDIAHSLANQCRWTGHTRLFFSTAQHCIIVSRIVEEKLTAAGRTRAYVRQRSLEGLMHDASEAFLSDIARPIKRHPDFGPFYKTAEDRLQAAVSDRFGLAWPHNEVVLEADDACMWAEKRDLMPSDDQDIAFAGAFAGRIRPWLPHRAEQAFMRRFREMGGVE